MKPIVKWQGGKSQLLDEIHKRLPEDTKRIIEPFVGGGAVFLDYEKPAVINDVNTGLVEVYKQALNNKKNFKAALKKKSNEFNNAIDKKQFYLDMRNKKPRTELRRAERFVFLNKTAFNGRYRENNKGEFNVPFSGTDKINLLLNETENTINNLKNVDIHNQDYKDFFDWYLNGNYQEGDFVFIDPPYDDCTINYTSSGFNHTDQENLKNYFDRLTELGIKGIVCNHNTEFIRDLYEEPGYEIDIVMAKRSINVKGDGRGKVQEIMVRNYTLKAYENVVSKI